MTPNVIVTRVAVQWHGQTPTAAWLAKRPEVMREYVIPSFMISSTAAVPMVWVWQAVPRHHEMLAAFAREVGATDYVWIQDRSEMTVPGVTGQRSVVSLRIDSDDVLHPEAIRSLSEIGLEPGHLLEFTRG